MRRAHVRFMATLVLVVSFVLTPLLSAMVHLYVHRALDFTRTGDTVGVVVLAASGAASTFQLVFDSPMSARTRFWLYPPLFALTLLAADSIGPEPVLQVAFKMD